MLYYLDRVATWIWNLLVVNSPGNAFQESEMWIAALMSGEYWQVKRGGSCFDVRCSVSQRSGLAVSTHSVLSTECSCIPSLADEW